MKMNELKAALAARSFDIKMVQDMAGGKRLVITNRKTLEKRVIGAILSPGDTLTIRLKRLELPIAYTVKAMEVSRPYGPYEETLDKKAAKR